MSSDKSPTAPAPSRPRALDRLDRAREEGVADDGLGEDNNSIELNQRNKPVYQNQGDYRAKATTARQLPPTALDPFQGGEGEGVSYAERMAQHELDRERAELQRKLDQLEREGRLAPEAPAKVENVKKSSRWGEDDRSPRAGGKRQSRFQDTPSVGGRPLRPWAPPGGRPPPLVRGGPGAIPPRWV
jgi:hypothetical protein